MEYPQIFLPEGQEPPSARWHAENGAAAPKRVVIADDTMTADTAFRLASEGVGLLWRSDFQNARQLLQALMRNCRLLSSIGLHTQGWKVEDSQRCFSEQAYADEGSARQQAARGTYDPAYLNYTLGKLMIMKLRQDWLAAPVAAGRPPRTLKDFHDQFLSYGGPPIPVVRKAMLGDADNGPVL